MTKQQLSYRLMVFILISTLAAGCTIATIRPLDPVTGKAIIGNEAEQFNAATYVEGIWDAQIVPTVQQEANDINTVITALQSNLANGSEQYGRRGDSQQPYSFLVTGSGTILSVNTESRAGLAPVDTNGDGNADISLAVGPVIRGTAIRDGMDFITFNLFTNQMEYAGVSNAINLRVNEHVVTPLGDITALAGQQVTFSGAFTLGTLNEIIVTPVLLSVGG